MRHLTARERDCLSAIRKLRRAGVAPTIRELSDALSVSSTHAVAIHLNNLRAKGAVVWNPKQARTLRLTRRGLKAVRVHG